MTSGREFSSDKLHCERSMKKARNFKLSLFVKDKKYQNINNCGG